MCRIRNRISTRAMAGLIFIAFVVCLLPLLYLSRYDVPCADDYIYGLEAHLTLVHGGSLTEAVAAAFRHTVSTYFNWQGSYSAIFLMCLQPAVFSERLYFLTPWLMSLSLFGGLFALSFGLMEKVFGMPRHIGTVLAGMVGALYLLLMPYPSESLYWFNGSVYYTFFHGIAMLAVSISISVARRGGLLRVAGLCLLALFLAGGNLITGLTLCLLAASGLVLLLLKRNFAGAIRLLLPALLLFVCFCVNVFAPGNAVRAVNEVARTPDAVGSILESFQMSARYAVRWTRLPVLGGMLVLGMIFRAVLPHGSFHFRLPGVFSLWSYCLFSAMFCPTVYTFGWAGPGRLQNIVFCSYLFLLALNVFYWTGWFCLRHERERQSEDGIKLLPMVGATALCFVLLAASAALHGGISLASAYTALSSGQAEVFYREAMERLVILKDPAVRVARLKPYSDPPYLLFFDDLYDDSDAWQNRDMANFYEKDRVILLPRDSD